MAPPGSSERSWYLHSRRGANSRYGDGRLLEAPPAGEPGADRLRHDPDRPVPFITSALSAQIGGPDDYAGVETRGDVLVYTSEPLTEPLDVIGPVSLVAHVATSAADADIAAKLLDVHPSGFAQRLCDGLTRLRYRDGHKAPVAVEPDAVYEIEVVMWDTAQRILPGHRIRLEVAGSAHPKFAVNLGIAGDQASAAEGVIADNVLHHGAARLVLTVLPTDD